MVEFRSNDPYRDTVREMFQAQARNMALTKSEPEKNRCGFFFFLLCATTCIAKLY